MKGPRDAKGRTGGATLNLPSQLSALFEGFAIHSYLIYSVPTVSIRKALL